MQIEVLLAFTILALIMTVGLTVSAILLEVHRRKAYRKKVRARDCSVCANSYREKGFCHTCQRYAHKPFFAEDTDGNY